MQHKHFEIENYRFIKGENILVHIVKDKMAIPITIPKEQFETFLLIKDKLILPLVFTDSGERLNSSCKITIDEYFEMDEQDIHQDLYQYITTHSITWQGVVFEKSLTSILLAFEIRKALRN